MLNIEYKQIHMVMMAMVTVVVHLVAEVSEVVDVVVCLVEDVVKLFVIIVTSQDIMQEIVRIPLRHVDIVKQLIMSLSSVQYC